jgi:hypothetical protein
MASGKKKKSEGGFDDAKELEGTTYYPVSGGPAPKTKKGAKKGAKKDLLKAAKTAHETLHPDEEGLAFRPSDRVEEEVQLGKNIAGGLRSLSKEGNLTADLLAEARERGLSGSAFDEGGFDSFLEKEGIGVSEEGGLDPYEAAQKVMGAKTGLDRLASMQDPNYQLGSGSSLRKSPRELGTRSGAMRRAARSLRRVGASEQANQMYGVAAAQKLGEPNIMTQEQRGRLAGQQQQAVGLMQKTQEQESRYRDLTNRLMEQRLKGMPTDEDEDEDERGGVLRYKGLGRNPTSKIGSATPKRGL